MEDVFKCGLGVGAGGWWGDVSSDERLWMDNETFCDS